jgi:hypothetical protein
MRKAHPGQSIHKAQHGPTRRCFPGRLGHRFANHGIPNGQHQKDFKHVATTVVDKKFQRGKNSRMSLHRKTKKDYGCNGCDYQYVIRNCTGQFLVLS